MGKKGRVGDKTKKKKGMVSNPNGQDLDVSLPEQIINDKAHSEENKSYKNSK